jgi:INO80 complex subunit C
MAAAGAAARMEGAGSPIAAGMDEVTFPFKKKHFTAQHAKRRNLKQIVFGIHQQHFAPSTATYTSIGSPWSRAVKKRYSDVTGLEAKYTDPKTKLRWVIIAFLCLVWDVGLLPPPSFW